MYKKKHLQSIEHQTPTLKKLQVFGLYRKDCLKKLLMFSKVRVKHLKFFIGTIRKNVETFTTDAYYI